MDRLGILEAEETKEEERKQRRKPLPAPYNPDKLMQSIEHSPHRAEHQKPRPKQKSTRGSLCCFGEAVSEGWSEGSESEVSQNI